MLTTLKKRFEQLIERALVGSTIEGLAEQGIMLTAKHADAQIAASEYFYWGLPKDAGISANFSVSFG